MPTLLLFLLSLIASFNTSALIAAEAPGNYQPQDYYHCVHELMLVDSPLAGYRVVTHANKIFLLNAKATYFFDRKLLNNQGVTEQPGDSPRHSISTKNVLLNLRNQKQVYIKVTRVPDQTMWFLDAHDVNRPRTIPGSFKVELVKAPKGIYQTIQPQVLIENSSSPTLNQWIIGTLPEAVNGLSKKLSEALIIEQDTALVIETFDKKIARMAHACASLGSAQINFELNRSLDIWEKARERTFTEFNTF